MLSSVICGIQCTKLVHVETRLFLASLALTHVPFLLAQFTFSPNDVGSTLVCGTARRAALRAFLLLPLLPHRSSGIPISGRGAHTTKSGGLGKISLRYFQTTQRSAFLPSPRCRDNQISKTVKSAWKLAGGGGACLLSCVIPGSARPERCTRETHPPSTQRLDHFMRTKGRLVAAVTSRSGTQEAERASGELVGPSEDAPLQERRAHADSVHGTRSHLVI